MNIIDEKILTNKIKKRLKIECAKKDTCLYKLSVSMGRNKNYLSNMFLKNTAISTLILYQAADKLDCKIVDLLPELEELKI